MSSALPRRLWLVVASFGAANLADGLIALAFPLLAAQLTRSPAQIAGATFALTLPWLLCALPAGALLDRLDRRQLSLLANAARAAALLLLSVLVVLDALTLPALYAAAFLIGTAATVTGGAAPTLVTALVSKAELERAGARVSGVQTLATEFAGPALGGLLLGLGMLAPLLSGGVFYLAALLTLTRLHGTFRVPPRARLPLWQEMREGMRFLAHHRLLRTLVLMTAGMNICWSAWLAIAPVHLGPHGPGGLTASQYGFVVAGLGIGGLLGVLSVSTLTQRLGRHRTIALDLLGTLGLIVTPALTTHPTLIFLSTVAGGFGGTLWSVLVGALRQRLVPDELLGRVTSASAMVSWGVLPLSAALAGVTAELLGTRAVFIAGGVLAALLVWPFVRVLSAERLQAPESEDDFSALPSGERRHA